MYLPVALLGICVGKLVKKDLFIQHIVFIHKLIVLNPHYFNNLVWITY